MARERKSEDERIRALEETIPEIQRFLGELRDAVAAVQTSTVLMRNTGLAQSISAPLGLSLYEQTLGLLRSLYWCQFILPQSLPVIPTGDGDPVGDPSKQCFKFVIENDKIKGGNKAKLAHLSNESQQCVELLSASVVDGRATFVVCCKKERGKCKDCSGYVELSVGSRNDETLVTGVKQVSIECKPVE